MLHGPGAVAPIDKQDEDAAPVIIPEDPATTILKPFATGESCSYMNGDQEIALPHNVYTMAICFWLISDETVLHAKGCSVSKGCEYWAAGAQCLFTLAAHYTVLSFLTYYLVHLEYSLDPLEFEPPDWILLSACLSVFTAFMVQEFSESYNMLKWLIVAPPAPRVQCFRIKFNPDKERMEVHSTMPRWAKVVSFFITVVPKVLFALVLQFYGAKLVIFSESNSDVLLNTLAAFFLAEVDDYAYQFLASRQLKKIIEDEQLFPPLYLEDDLSFCNVWSDLFKFCGVICGPCCQTGIIMFVSWYMYFYWCIVRLGYGSEKWEIAKNASNGTLSSDAVQFVHPKGFLEGQW